LADFDVPACETVRAAEALVNLLFVAMVPVVIGVPIDLRNPKKSVDTVFRNARIFLADFLKCKQWPSVFHVQVVNHNKKLHPLYAFRICDRGVRSCWMPGWLKRIKEWT